MKVPVNSIRAGNVIEYNGKLWVASKVQHISPGKGGAFVAIEAKALREGNKLQERFRSGETIEHVHIDERDCTYLFKDENGFTFMDKENYEQLTVGADVLDPDQSRWLQDGMEVHVSLYEGAPVGVELPKTRRAGRHRGRCRGEGPDRLLVLQARHRRRRHPRDGAAAHRRRHQAGDQHRGRQLHGTRQGLIVAMRPDVRRDQPRRPRRPRPDGAGPRALGPARAPLAGAALGHHHRDDPRRLRRGQEPEARLRRGRASAGLREGPGRLRQPRRHQGRAHAARRACAHPAGVRLPRRGRRRDQGRRPQPLDRRPARRHDQFPARRAALRHLDRRSSAKARSSPASSTSRSPTSCSGPRRATAPSSTRPTPARAGCACRAARIRRARWSRTGIPIIGKGDHADYHRKLAAVTAATAGVRRWGAAALDLAFVAAGRYDAFFEFGLAPWDVAAGMLLVREAGGIVSDIAGQALRAGRPVDPRQQLRPARADGRDFGRWPAGPPRRVRAHAHAGLSTGPRADLMSGPGRVPPLERETPWLVGANLSKGMDAILRSLSDGLPAGLSGPPRHCDVSA